jgi:hypothetical protein
VSLLSLAACFLLSVIFLAALSFSQTGRSTDLMRWRLIDSLRRGYGERRPLIEAPGHVFTPAESPKQSD